MLTRTYNPKPKDQIDPILLNLEFASMDRELARFRRLVDGQGDVECLTTTGAVALNP